VNTIDDRSVRASPRLATLPRMLGAEIHNSSSSTRAAITESFEIVAELGADTILAPVSWALFEPQEGTFDPSLVHEMIAAARTNGLRLAPLWFGSWKNGMSSYAPSWVKTDPARFPRAETTGGRIEHLSPFGAESRAADARAFAAVMRELAAARDLVPFVQVENEVGLLGDSRDRGLLAEAAFDADIPSAVLAAIADSPQLPVHANWSAAGRRESGSWRETLGDGIEAEEAFMAHAYAAYIDDVAAAGRVEFDVPLIVNAWLDSDIDLDIEEPGTGVALAGGQRPGTYPSGGPLPRVAPIWRAAAPQIDLLAPDIYFGDFESICAQFRGASGALFIPEMRRSELGVAQMFVALGEYGAVGVSPFGVDSLDRSDAEFARLRDAYGILGYAARVLTAAPLAARRGFLLDGGRPSRTLELGDLQVTVDNRPPFDLGRAPLPAYGLVIEEVPGTVVVLGRGFSVSFSTGSGRVGILSAEELSVDGTVVRNLGGDETGSGSSVRIPDLGMRQSEVFPIPATITSTGIVRIATYRY
jgi:hypothetical protein